MWSMWIWMALLYIPYCPTGLRATWAYHVRVFWMADINYYEISHDVMLFLTSLYLFKIWFGYFLLSS
jgi:hypothetical protein